MAMDGLPERVPPFGRVPEQLLQAAPILKRRRRRYRGEIAEKGFVLGVSTPRAKYRRRGGRGGGGPAGGKEGGGGGGGGGGTHQSARRVPGAAQGGSAPPALLAGWGWPPSAPLVILEASVALIFYIFFSEFLEHF